MSKLTEAEISKFKEEYQNLKTTFDDSLISLKTEIDKLLSESEINLAIPIQYRTKTWDSILEKFDRIPINLKNITDMQDLCGLRIILLFSRDAKSVADLLNKHLKVIKFYDTVDRLENNQFGYSSTHLIANLPSEWLKVPTMKNFKGIKFEIQVRTISQHLWSEASNLLQYKKEQSIPKSVLRSVSRASALLETVDLEFERVLEERESYRNVIKTSSKSESDEELNVDLLEQILDNYFPAKNKAAEENYTELIKDLQMINVKTKNELITLINKNLDIVLEKEKQLVDEKLENLKKSKSLGTSKERILAGVFYKHTGLLRALITSEAGTHWFSLKKAKPKEKSSNN